MEETEKASSIYGGRNPRASIYGVRDSESLHQLNEELHINYPRLSNREFFMRYVRRDPLPTNPPPMTCLEESPSSSSSRDAPKIKDQGNSVRIWKCGECDKVFNKEKALFGHKRVHAGKGSKVSEEAFVIPEQKTVSTMTDHEIYTEHRASKVRRVRKHESVTDRDIDSKRPFSESSCAIKKGGWDVHLDMNISVEELASFLIDLSQSDGKTHTCKKCNRSFPSQKTLHEHIFSQSVDRKNEVALKRKNQVVLKSLTELKRKNEVALKPSTDRKSGKNKPKSLKKEPKSKSHICEVCSKEYATGQELGGHKRAHSNNAAKT